MGDKLSLYILIACTIIVLVGLADYFVLYFRRKKSQEKTGVQAHADKPCPFSAADPAVPQGLRVDVEQVNTDCMAKVLTVRVTCSSGWDILIENNPSWVKAENLSGRLLQLYLSTNFESEPREALVHICPAAGTNAEEATIRVIQCETDYYPEISLSESFFVQAGDAEAIVRTAVVPGKKCDEWSVLRVYTNNEGGWCDVEPAIGEKRQGKGTLRVRTFPKPAHMPVRNAVVTVGCGTYPFQTIRTLVVSQGIVFNYYIEYPAFDTCYRSREAIETPLNYREGDPLCSYTIYVHSNLPWKLMSAACSWMIVSKPELEQEERYNGRFVVTVYPNDESSRYNGFCAARHTVIRIVTEKGQVQDIQVYQGGYVMMRGRRWLDRNLVSPGQITENALPVGLLPGKNINTLINGNLFQFGQKSLEWSASLPANDKGWNLNTDEHPVRNEQTDPSPKGWRVPSSLELLSLFGYKNCVPEYSANGWAVLASDNGIPVYFPFSGYRYHINGCLMERWVEGCYWSSKELSAIYTDAVVLRMGRPTYFAGQLKKQSFSIRCIEA